MLEKKHRFNMAKESIIKDFLYRYCKKVAVEPSELELEELLEMFVKYYKRKENGYITTKKTKKKK